MHTEILDLTLSSYVFQPGNMALTRDRLGEWRDRDPNYDTRYDYYTLIYDVFFDADQQKVFAVCPTLRNFERLVLEAEFALDGQTVPIAQIRPLSRGSLIEFDLPPGVLLPLSLSVQHPMFSGVLPVGATHRDMFAGTNAIYAISKDNRLDWIVAWLSYYVKEHGANALVLYDNQSTAYSMEDLKAAIASVPGIEKAALVRAWFPFGPGGQGNTNFNSKFLHMTMVELGRRRLLSNARAVLNVDIDELVYSRTGHSIFDATVESERGYVRMNGDWVYAPAPMDGAVPRHADHLLVRKDGLPKVNRKYCVAPTGPLEGRPWLTHRIVSRRDPADPDFGFWHFRSITNNWDYDREDFDPEAVEQDDRLVETMARHFGPGANALAG